MEDLAKEVLAHFTWTHNGGIRFTGNPKSALDGIDLSFPSEECSQALRQEVNYMIHHALLCQIEVILNSMDNIVARMVKSVLTGEYEQDIGPVINPHVREKKFYTRQTASPSDQCS